MVNMLQIHSVLPRLECLTSAWNFVHITPSTRRYFNFETYQIKQSECLKYLEHHILGELPFFIYLISLPLPPGRYETNDQWKAKCRKKNWLKKLLVNDIHPKSRDTLCRSSCRIIKLVSTLCGIRNYSQNGLERLVQK